MQDKNDNTDKYDKRSPLGIPPAEQTEVAAETNPERSSERPHQSAEVPLGTGTHAEPPGGGGRQSQRVTPEQGKDAASQEKPKH